MNENFFNLEKWNNLKKRYTQFWESDTMSRSMFRLCVPSKSEYNSTWFDIDGRVSDQIGIAKETTYLADAFPNVFVNFGPGVLAACIGSGFVCDDNTIWFDRDPILKSWDDVSKIKFDENSFMWKKIMEMTEKVSDNNELLCASVTDIGGTLDIIASLRGTQELLFDIIDYPDEVLSLIEKIEPIWELAFDKITVPLIKKQGGMTSWLPIWCKGRYAPLQCDFSAMISPDMFKEFVLPNLIRQTEFLDHSIYHLDGPGEIPHLDHLLSIPRLNAIQWVSGAGAKSVADPCWYEMYEKIFAAKKGLMMFTDTPEEAEILIRRFPKERLLVATDCNDIKYAKELERLHETL